MKSARRHPRPPAPPAAGDGSGFHRTAGAVLTAAVVLAAAWFFPGYHNRLTSGVEQTRLLEHRFAVSFDDMGVFHWREEYPRMAMIRDRTFEDANIVISDNPADGKLASISWVTFFLYPRRIYHAQDVDLLPDVIPDYLLVTPNFPDLIPAEQRGSFVALSPLSDRAVAYAEQFLRGTP